MSITDTLPIVLDETDKRPAVTCHHLGATAVLQPVIDNITCHLAAYFPGNPIRVETGWERIYITVRVDLPPDEALARMWLFDDEWWLDHLHSGICVTFRF